MKTATAWQCPASPAGTPPFPWQPGFNRAANASGVIDGVDGAHVVAMAMLGLASIGLADSERRAEERRLNVVHAQRIPRQQCRHPNRRESGLRGVALGAGANTLLLSVTTAL